MGLLLVVGCTFLNVKRVFNSNAKLEGILGEIKNEMSQINTIKNIQPNLSKSEHTALRELYQDKNLIIKKSDKGSDLVIQNKADLIPFHSRD